MNNPLNPNGAGLSEAANQFEALLAGDTPDNQTPNSDDVVMDSEVSTEEPLEAEASEDETLSEDTYEGSDESAEDEEATADAEEDSEDSSDEIQLVTVKIDGKEEQIPLEEAIRGYQRHADYSRKMNDLAQNGKTLEAELNEVKTERAQYAELLNALQSQIAQGGEQEPDWEALYAENPLEYVRQKDLWRDRRDRLEAISAEQQRLAYLHEQEQKQNISRIIQESQRQLIEAVPDWKDGKKWEQDRSAIRDYGRKLGFSDEELSQAYDHRAVLALYKAMKYDSLMSKRPQPQQKSGSPKVSSAGTAMNTPPAKTNSAIKNAKQRLKQTGSVGDAAALFEKLL